MKLAAYLMKKMDRGRFVFFIMLYDKDMKANPKHVLVDSKSGKALDQLTPQENKDLSKRLAHSWAWCTDNEDIMWVLHYWIGAERVDGRKTGQPFFLVSSPDFNKIVTFWEDAEGNLSLTKGESLKPFDMPLNRKAASNMRGAVLEAFIKLEFILDHLMLLRYGVYSSTGNPKEALETVRRLNSASKISALRKISDYQSVNFAAIERIKTLRNKLSHQFSLHNIEYGGLTLSRDDDDNGQKMTDELNKDYDLAMQSLIEVYYANQQKVAEWLLDILKTKPN